MDIVAVLTKVVREQKEAVEKQQAGIKTLTEKLAQLEAKMEGLQTWRFPFLSSPRSSDLQRHG